MNMPKTQPVSEIRVCPAYYYYGANNDMDLC